MILATCGGCHGAVKGQNGFRLSLFGADPAGDHDRLMREFGGRRINLTDASASLLLRKATGQAEHGGGVRLRADSFEYEVLRKWIATGAKADTATSAQNGCGHTALVAAVSVRRSTALAASTTAGSHSMARANPCCGSGP